MTSTTTARAVLPAVPEDAPWSARAAQCGSGALDELAQWEGYLRYVGGAGALELADVVARARSVLYLRAKAVIEGAAVQPWRDEATAELQAEGAE
jgi:hypothetical protein